MMALKRSSRPWRVSKDKGSSLRRPGQGRLDRFSAIIVEQDFCPVESVTRIEGEPPKDPRRS
jgi:hypothetical protein